MADAMVPITKKLRDRKSSASHSEEKTYVFVPPFFMAKKMAGEFLTQPAILNRILRQKLQNFAVK